MSDVTPTELREAYEASQKALKKAESEAQKLAAENRSLKASNVFQEAGLSPDLANLFVAADPDADISVDAAKAFAEKYGIGSAPSVSDDDADDPTPAPETDGLDNISRAGSRAGGSGQPPASQKLLTRQEFVQLQVSDPVAAQKALAEGRVRLRNDNPYAAGTIPTAGANPFTAQNGAEA